jgi:hypothetical protein
LATPNYGYEKRQKELAKKKKKEEKLKQKVDRKTGDGLELNPNEVAEQAAEYALRQATSASQDQAEEAPELPQVSANSSAPT